MKLLTKKLIDRGGEYYVAQVGMRWEEARVLRDLVQTEIKRQRLGGKEDTYVFLKNSIAALHDACKQLNYAYDKRQQGRYLKKTAPPIKGSK